jgi:hypothetical protein
MTNVENCSDDDLIKYAESLGFEPDWFDDGESILGIALWNAPDGTAHTIVTLRDAVRAHLKTPASSSDPYSS